MLKINEEKFQEMDALSQKKESFFFMINFLMDEVLLFTQKDLEEQKVFVNFPHFSNVKKEFKSLDIKWQTYPQSLKTYQKGFEKVQHHLKRGDSYVVNYTCETPVEINCTLEEIFQSSSSKYSVLLPHQFTFFSPETFIEIKDGVIFTHPMKGTIDATIPNAQEKLKQDVKEKAEHFTVVDLLRNDLSMVADEVQVKELQRIDFLKTRQKDLFAMSSEIAGKVKPEFLDNIGSVMKKLLPAGSILGAPKAKTLEIILEAELYNRGFYTGVAGYFDGENLDSCVMIRFLEQKNNQFFFKSGGGITHMSNLADEYQEMINKIYVPIH